MPYRFPLLLLAFCAPAACADLLTPLTQSRNVYATATSDISHDENQVSGPASGPWLGTADAEARFVAFDTRASASAVQFSELGPDGVAAFGFTSLEVHATVPIFTEAHADSLFRTRFAVAERLTVDVGGLLSAESEFGSGNYSPGFLVFDVWLRLKQVAGPTLYTEHITFAQNDAENVIESRALSFATILDPGVYELEISALVELEPANVRADEFWRGETSFVATLEAAPAPPLIVGEGDLDGDGDVDIADFARMQAGFSGPRVGP